MSRVTFELRPKKLVRTKTGLRPIPGKKESKSKNPEVEMNCICSEKKVCGGQERRPGRLSRGQIIQTSQGLVGNLDFSLIEMESQ